MAQTLDTDAIRRRLEDERTSLQEQIDELDLRNDEVRDEDNDGVSNHPGDDATDVFVRERNIPVLGNAQDLLAEVNAALERLDNGTYGTCARCGQPIDPARLEARPAAIYCISCQEIVDQET